LYLNYLVPFPRLPTRGGLPQEEQSRIQRRTVIVTSVASPKEDLKKAA